VRSSKFKRIKFKLYKQYICKRVNEMLAKCQTCSRFHQNIPIDVRPEREFFARVWWRRTETYLYTVDQCLDLVVLFVSISKTTPTDPLLSFEVDGQVSMPQEYFTIKMHSNHIFRQAINEVSLLHYFYFYKY